MQDSPQIADLLTREDCLKLMERYGGGVLTIPTPARVKHHPLREILGPDTATNLANRHGGARVYINKLDSATKRERNELIRERRRAGSTIQALATEFSLSTRMIHYLCEGIKPEQAP